MIPISTALVGVKLTSIFAVNSPAGPGGELWKSVRRIGKGKEASAKGGSKCPGPELKEKGHNRGKNALSHSRE